jgi:iron complex transport system permease protein
VSATTIARPTTAVPRVVVLPSHGARLAGLGGCALLLAACAVASLALGSRSIPVAEVLRAFTAYDGSDAHAIVRDLRVPRTELALLVGAALGAAGALMQGVTRNPLAEPGILGINAGAAFAVVLAISLAGIHAVSGYVSFALLGAGLTAVLVYGLGGSSRGGPTPIRLALAGAVLNTLLVSLTSAVLVFDAQTLDEFRFWMVGSLAGRESGVMLAVLPAAVAGLAIAFASGRRLNALALGDEVARSLGQHVGRTRLVAGAGFVLLAGAAVAAAGPVAFVGLAVPHVARALVGADYRWIVPYSVVLGGVALLAADVTGRLVASPAELEVGIVAALVGAPFLVWLVRRRGVVAL